MMNVVPRTDEYDVEDMDFLDIAYQVSRIGSDFDRRPRRAYTLGELTQSPATKQWLAQQNKLAIEAYREMKREIVRKRLAEEKEEEKEERQDAIWYEKHRLRIKKARAEYDIEVAEYLAESDMTEEQKELHLKVIAGMDEST